MHRRQIMSLLSLFGLAGNATAPAAAAPPQPAPIPLRLSEGAWKQRLSPAAFRVLRQEGTEAPGSSALNEERRKGVFHCAGCQ